MQRMRLAFFYIFSIQEKQHVGYTNLSVIGYIGYLPVDGKGKILCLSTNSAS